jgi:prepilin-type N-terminal cleavage/methylation domain-containing protein
MRFSSPKRSGFTLIELLVVITIIGILATGATATYTSQIQKARDTSRVNDVKTLQSATEQYYQDFQVYPSKDDDATASGIASSGGVIRYASKVPKDQKLGQTCAKYSSQTSPTIVPCGYTYNVSPDDNNIANGSYELATAFENKGNVDSKALNDDNGGVYGAGAANSYIAGTKDASRLELGIRTQTGINTNIDLSTFVTNSSSPNAIVTAAYCGTSTTKVIAAGSIALTVDNPASPGAIICGNNN